MLKIITSLALPLGVSILSKVIKMTATGAVALILFSNAGIFICIAWWMKSSEYREGDAAKLFIGIAVVLAIAAVATLILGSSNPS